MGRRPHPVVGATDGDALRRAKALAAPTRVAVLDLLRGADEPRTPQQLAADLGVHHTAVRQHLAVLLDAGLVSPVRLPPEGRGRPKVAYRVLSDPQPYHNLALMLADAVSEGLTAREAGRLHGRRVEPSADGPLATLQVETERLGFRPKARDRGRGVHEIVLQACPFADVAATNASTVCDLHRGIAEGVAERAGGLEVVDLHTADPHKGGCRLVTRLT